MPKMRLSFVTNRHERVEPLCDGTVPIEGVELVTTYSDPSETFWRQLKPRCASCFLFGSQ